MERGTRLLYFRHLIEPVRIEEIPKVRLAHFYYSRSVLTGIRVLPCFLGKLISKDFG